MKVSVIIPVYNVEPYVEDCLRSVMNQTLTDIEMICIDDRGDDASIDIVKRLMAEDSRISLFVNEKNMGLATARNRGMERATGEYVYFLDSDDMITKNALEELYGKAEKECLDACIFSADFIYEDESLRKIFGTNPAKYKGSYPDIMTGKELFIEWMKVWDWMPSQPRYFYKRSFLENSKIRFIDGLLHEDETFAFDVLMYAKRVRVIDEPFFIRRCRASSIMSSTPTMRNVESCIEILSHVDAYEKKYAGENDENAGKDDSKEINKVNISDKIASADFCVQNISDAIGFYEFKIFMDVTRKLRAVRHSGQSAELSQKLLESPEKISIFSAVKERSLTELYACSSYYQIMIAIMKAMSQGIRIDLVLEKHGIETAEELADRIGNHLPEYVNHVFVCPTFEDIDPYEQKGAVADPELSARLSEHVERVFGNIRPVMDYEKVNVFWDLGYVGTYMNIKGVKYTLHEDSLNSYKVIRENRPNYQYIFDEKSRAEHKGVIPFGYSPFCEAVEVNDTEGIQIPMDKVTGCSREEMMKNLSKEQKKALFQSFVSGDFSVEGETLLLLTEPFFVTGRLPDEESQVELYTELISRFGQNKNVIIKAHPRDTVDYGKYFPEATVLEKNMPMEILNFDESITFDTAVTVTSSVINGLTRVDKKVTLGAEYLREIQNR